jgi:hypothetical protein
LFKLSTSMFLAGLLLGMLRLCHNVSQNIYNELVHFKNIQRLVLQLQKLIFNS